MDNNNLATVGQFNLLSQMTDKEGTSHFYGIGLTNSELNNYQDSALNEDQPYENKENNDYLINVKEPQLQTVTDESQNDNILS